MEYSVFTISGPLPIIECDYILNSKGLLYFMKRKWFKGPETILIIPINSVSYVRKYVRKYGRS